MKKIIYPIIVVCLSVLLVLPIFGEKEEQVLRGLENSLRSKDNAAMQGVKISKKGVRMTTGGRSAGGINHASGASGTMGAGSPSALSEDRIIVKFKNGRGSASERAALASLHGMTQARRVAHSNLYVYKVRDAGNRKQVMHELKRNSAVEYAEPDFIIHLNTTPNDGSYNSLWGLHNTGQTGGTADADIDAPEAWALETGSPNVIVAVIDTGVDYAHPDLAANMWVNTGETAGDNIDNDGNGYIDDIHGINGITLSGDPMDDHSHGTHCSGTIGGVGNNGTGVAGVCWNVKIMALKFLSSGGSGYISDAVTCVNYAVAHGAHIMSNSWGGGGYSQAMADAIQAAQNAGVLFIAAAGNSAVNNDVSPHYPSSYSHANVIAVAATDHNDNMASFSCYGPTSVDVGAPGKSIYSTVLNGGYASYSGTSMATPHVSGLAALIKSHQPGLTALEIKARILDTVEEVPALQDKILTAGRINAFYALTDNSPPSVTVTGPQDFAIVSGAVTVAVDASHSGGIAKVAFYVDDVLVIEDTAAPWEFAWDSTLASDQQHVIKAVAFNQLGRTAEDRVTLQVNNTGLPGVVITQPLAGSTVAGVVTIGANVGYAPGIGKVEYLIDDVLLGEAATEPYEYDWNTASSSNGAHTVTVRAVGTDARVGTAQVNVTIDNIVIPESERNALLALYDATNGANWTDNANWRKEDGSPNDMGTEHTWEGITVEDNHVVSIYLSSNNLTGTLPPELGDLPKLRTLALYYNTIGGILPPELGKLTLLEYLDVDDNALTGPIPPELGNLAALEILWLDDNTFSGGIPAQLGNLGNLEYLYAWDCGLTGPIPPELGNLGSIIELSLYYNQLSGPIPPELGNLTTLEYLDLESNQLTGAIPPELGNLTNAWVLWLSDNQFTGPIPPELGNLGGLYYLYLYDNQLSGEIPPELGALVQLQALDLSGNQLTGEIPTQLTGLANLASLYLSGNQLSGPVPAELGNLSGLKFLMLYNNQFSGAVPAGLGNLSNLIYLALHNNQLTGGLPPELGDLSGLRYLFLYNNQFSGEIPPEFGNLADLVGVWLHNNRLSGEIPPEIGGMTSLKYLMLYRNRFSGPLPPELGNLTNMKYFYCYGNMLSGSIPTTLTAWSDLTYADIKYNGLYTDNDALKALLDRTCPGWAGTQTIAPTDVAAQSLGDGNVEITWTRIPYMGNTGEYRVHFGASSGGTYPDFTATADKTASTLTVTGLNAGTTYYFTVQTRTEPHSYNQNVLESEFSLEVSADTSVSPGAVTVSAPNGGESWNTGSAHNITWTASGVSGDVTIDLYKNAAYHSTLTTAAVGDNSFTWNIPAGFTPADNYQVKVSQGAVEDYSDGSFSVIQPKTAPAGSPDFNNDGNVDILWRHSTLGYNMVWFMNGLNKIRNAYIPRLKNTKWQIMGADDFDKDGKVDLLWRHSTLGYNLVWFMNGVTKVRGAYIQRVKNLDWKIVGTGDFDKDGKVDILWRHSTLGYNMVWFMNGLKKIRNAYIPRLKNLNWKIVSTGDFNKDGNLDVLWRHSTLGYNLVWFMNGVKKIKGAYIKRVTNTAWEIMAAADFDKDGHLDILWRHATAGYNLVWFMNGLNKVRSAYLQRLKNNNWKIVN